MNPFYAVRFLVVHGPQALVVLGGVFLVTTGAEALYADLGHFGRKPIAVAWYWVVFPALILNYLGQGALVLRDPARERIRFSHGSRLDALAVDCAGNGGRHYRLSGAHFGRILLDDAVCTDGLHPLSSIFATPLMKSTDRSISLKSIPCWPSVASRSSLDFGAATLLRVRTALR